MRYKKEMIQAKVIETCYNFEVKMLCHHRQTFPELLFATQLRFHIGALFQRFWKTRFWKTLCCLRVADAYSVAKMYNLCDLYNL